MKIVKKNRVLNVTCNRCFGEMVRGRFAQHDRRLQAVGVPLFLALAVAGGWLVTRSSLAMVFGGALVLMASLLVSQMGYRRADGWKCPNCGYAFEVDQ